MLPHEDKGFLAADAKHQPRRAKIAIGDEQIVGLHPRQELPHQGAFLGIGVFAQHQIGDQAEPRFVHHQRLARQAGIEPLPQRGQAMFAAGQHIAVEDAHAIASQRFGPGLGQQSQHLATALGAVPQQRLADCGIEPSQLAINRLKRSADERPALGLVGFVGRIQRSTHARGHLNEQTHQGADGQFARILLRSVLLEKLFQGRLVEHPFQRATNHNSQRHRLRMIQKSNRNRSIRGVHQQLFQQIGLPRLGWKTHPCLSGKRNCNPLRTTMIRHTCSC